MILYNCVIVEDEVNSFELLKKIIEEYCPSLQLVGHARSVGDAVELLQSQSCDILFLDIEIEGGKSFDVLKQIDNIDFSIIFTTAYDTYAIEAFKVDAVDYILKPYAPTDIIAAVQRVVERMRSSASFKTLKALFSQGDDQRISFSTMKGIRFCKVNEIVRMEAEGAYCTVFINLGEKIVISKTLVEVEKKLPRDQFIRTHAKHSINKRYIKQVLHADGGYVEMKDGTIVPLARRRKQFFLNQIM
jgi:two-component system LytT family response regulator